MSVVRRLFELQARDVSPPTRRRIAVALALTACIGGPASADTVVHFWLSPSPNGPVVPTLFVPPGETGQVHAWARPAVDSTMHAFSLNLVAENPGVIEFEEIVVLNPVIAETGGAHRHQLVFGTPQGLFAEEDGVRGFSGFSFFSGGGLPDGVGVGPDGEGDPEFAMPGGMPAWRLATITLRGATTGSTPLFLEIGTQGVWQSPADALEPTDPIDTSAVFGLANDTVHGWGADEIVDRRNMHVGLADAMVEIALADFDENGLVDGADLLRWQRGLGVGNSLGEGNANNDAAVNATDLAAWTYQFGSTFAVVANAAAVPEPSGIIAVAPVLLALTLRGGHIRQRSRKHSEKVKSAPPGGRPVLRRSGLRA